VLIGEAARRAGVSCYTARLYSRPGLVACELDGAEIDWDQPGCSPYDRTRAEL
jgi:hypothetical protein